MTTNEISTETPNDTWAAQLAALKARYPHVRDAILMALYILMQDPGVSLEDAKAQANVHGTRITSASVSAARRLLSRMDTAPAAPATEPAAAPAPTRPVRRPRVPEATLDAEALIRGVVAKIQGQGNVELERLKDSVRKAIQALTVALG